MGPGYSNFWGGYWGYGWGAPYGTVTGGEVRTDYIVSIETLIYSVKQNKLVFGAQSKTTNPPAWTRWSRGSRRPSSRSKAEVALTQNGGFRSVENSGTQRKRRRASFPGRRFGNDARRRSVPSFPQTET
jgi:hypothetical protein